MGPGRCARQCPKLVAVMEPRRWAAQIVDYLERNEIVGTLLPRGAGNAIDRYQPSRVFVRYLWSGNRSANTEIRFKVRRPANRADVSRVGEYTVSSATDIADWGDGWEQISICVPGESVTSLEAEIHEPERFRVRISVRDSAIDDGAFLREIILENLREQGGILYAVRVDQANLPKLMRIRPYGIEADLYYRAGGLIGFLEENGSRLAFRPCALLPEPLRRPLAGPTIDEALAQRIVTPETGGVLREGGFSRLHQFQALGMSEISRGLEHPADSLPILLTAGTAVGKTETFLVPLLDTLVEDRPHPGVRAVFVYPTKALSADQARRFFAILARFNRGRANPISIGILDGDTPWSEDKLREQERNEELRSAFSTCPAPDCGGRVRFTTALDGARLSASTCDRCGAVYSWLRAHRGEITSRWPHLLLTTPDMLHRSISDNFAWMRHAIFGGEVHVCNCGQFTTATPPTLRGERTCQSCRRALEEPISTSPSVLVFDEAHLYKGAFGSQVAMLIARVQRIARQYGHHPLLVAASATIANPEDFGRQLFGQTVRVVAGLDEPSENQPATRFHLFLMPIQVTVLNAVGHILAGCLQTDRQQNEHNRVLVFSDSKRTVYQLESSLPEFYGTTLPAGEEPPTTRSHTADLGSDERRRIEAEFDRDRIRVLLATQTLEVGVDFQQLPLELQVGATYSYNDYIQRVGRAGRQGFPALVMCILRPQVPLDYYYFEHCRELVQMSQETLDAVPIRTDNPFLVARHLPAAIQDYLIAQRRGSALVWSRRGEGARLLTENRADVISYLRDIFLREHSWDRDLIDSEIERGIDRVLAILSNPGGKSLGDRLAELIELSIRATDRPVAIVSEDFASHEGISMAGELAFEEIEEPGEPEADQAEDSE